jgi:hypothetical protein
MIFGLVESRTDGPMGLDSGQLGNRLTTVTFAEEGSAHPPPRVSRFCGVPRGSCGKQLVVKVSPRLTLPGLDFSFNNSHSETIYALA